MLNKVRRFIANGPAVAVSPEIDEEEGSTAIKAATRVDQYEVRRERHEIQRRKRARQA